jgi:hypothetical protein
VRFPDDREPPDPSMKVTVGWRRWPPRPRGAGEEAAWAGKVVDEGDLKMERIPGSRSTYEGLMTRTPEGEYRFQLLPLPPGYQLQQKLPQAEGRVLAPPGEMELLRMNQPDMERAAEEARGKFYSLAEADRLVAELPAGARVSVGSKGKFEVWNNPLIFMVALLFLSVEWLLRKRKHLL